jgi:hypothetical protein
MQSETVRVTDLLASSVPIATIALTDTSRACVSPLGMFAGYVLGLVETVVSPGQPMQSETVRVTDLLASSVPCATGAVADTSLACVSPLDLFAGPG